MGDVAAPRVTEDDLGLPAGDDSLCRDQGEQRGVGAKGQVDRFGVGNSAVDRIQEEIAHRADEGEVSRAVAIAMEQQRLGLVQRLDESWNDGGVGVPSSLTRAEDIEDRKASVVKPKDC